jgi:hypothetical protein
MRSRSSNEQAVNENMSANMNASNSKSLSTKKTTTAESLNQQKVHSPTVIRYKEEKDTPLVPTTDTY